MTFRKELKKLQSKPGNQAMCCDSLNVYVWKSICIKVINAGNYNLDLFYLVYFNDEDCVSGK